MRAIERGAFLFAAGAASAAIAVGGCGNTAAPEVSRPATPRHAPKGAGRITCQAIKPHKWEPIGDQLKADAVAANLGVTDEQVQDGKIGKAECDPAVPADPVGAGEAVKVTVEGMDGIEAGDCLVIGLNSGGQPPQPHQSYRGVIAACAAPPGFQAA